MTDTEIVDEILRLLHKENAGHFDRVNLLDALSGIDLVIKDQNTEYSMNNLEVRMRKHIDKLHALIGGV